MKKKDFRKIQDLMVEALEEHEERKRFYTDCTVNLKNIEIPTFGRIQMTEPPPPVKSRTPKEQSVNPNAETKEKIVNLLLGELNNGDLCLTVWPDAALPPEVFVRVEYRKADQVLHTLIEKVSFGQIYCIKRSEAPKATYD